MANVAVAENHLTVGGVAYFRGNADKVEFGSIGVKRTPLGKQNYIEVKDRLPVDKVGKTKSTVVEIDFTKTSKSAFGTAISAIVEGVPVKFTGDASFEKMRSGELKLVQISAMLNDVRDAINKSPKAMADLVEWGNDAVVVTSVFLVMEAKLANRFNNNVDVSLSAGIKGMEAKVSGGNTSSGTTTVTWSKDSCFAYLLAKPKWDASQKKNVTRATDLKTDQWG